MGDTYKPADAAYEAAQDKQISDAIRARRAARGAPSPAATSAPAPATKGLISQAVDAVRGLLSHEKDTEGRAIGTGGRRREQAVMRAVDEASAGRRRQAQSTDHQNGY